MGDTARGLGHRPSRRLPMFVCWHLAGGFARLVKAPCGRTRLAGVGQGGTRGVPCGRVGDTAWSDVDGPWSGL